MKNKKSLARVRLTKVPAVQPAADVLRSLAELQQAKTEEYGPTWKTFGPVVMALFPKGFTIEDEDEANRLALFFHIIDKSHRYANNFKRGGHYDSLKDISVYAALLGEYDGIVRRKTSGGK